MFEDRRIRFDNVNLCRQYFWLNVGPFLSGIVEARDFMSTEIDIREITNKISFPDEKGPRWDSNMG